MSRSSEPGALAGGAGQPPDLSARDRILDAAERLFAERGFDRTSTASIAAAASVPHGLVFYHFKTKMDLLLAVVRDRDVLELEDLLSAPGRRTALTEAIAELWIQLSAALGRPSIIRRIIFQELAAHPEVRQRALELHDQISAVVSRQLARVSGHYGEPGPEHEAAGRLLTIAAGMVPLLGEPGQARLDAQAVASLVAHGLSSARLPADEGPSALSGPS